MFGTQQAVFSVTRNDFGNGKQLARKGEKAPPKSSLFTGRRRAPERNFYRTGSLAAFGKNRKAWNKPKPRGRGGRPPKTDTAKNCVMVRFTDEEYARFLALFEQSGTLSKAAFVKARVFGDEFRVIRSDRGTMEFAARLTAFNAQFRKIGVNYNQIVKELHAHFSPKKALALLYKLENETRELVAVGAKIATLAEEFRQRW